MSCSALIDTYNVEPYVVAADVYAILHHAGREGWSWYTRPTGRTYRLITESLLLLQRSGDTSLLPAGWPDCVLHYRFGNTHYRIEVRNSASPEPTLSPDGQLLVHATLQVKDDGKLHQVIAQCQRCLLPTN